MLERSVDRNTLIVSSPLQRALETAGTLVQKQTTST